MRQIAMYELIERAKAACDDAARLCVHAIAVQQRIAIRRGKTLTDLIHVQEAAERPSEPHCLYCGKPDCTEHLDLEQELVHE